MKEKSATNAERSGKAKASRKSIPTSAEHIIDSDLEVDAGIQASGPSSSSDLKSSKRGLPRSNGTKRKSLYDPESSSFKKAKTTSVKQDQRNKHRNASDSLERNKSYLNGSSEARSRPRTRSTSSDRTDSRSQASSDGTREKILETPEKKPKSTTKVFSSNVGVLDSPSTQSESEMEPATEEEEEEEEEEESSRRSVLSDDTSGQAANSDPVQTASQELPPYRPPAGFSVASIRVDSANDIRSILSPENLSGKQLWHITVPANTSISDIKKTTHTQILNGKPVMSHGGTKYGFSLDTEHASLVKVLIPSRTGNKYQPIAKNIDLNLHLRQVVDLPDLTNNSAQWKQSSNSITGARKTKLEQPAGLRMRYRPFGDVEDDVNERIATRQAEQRMDNTKIPLPTIPSSMPESSKKSKKSKKNPQPSQEPLEWTDPQSYSAPIVVGGDSQHTTKLPSTDPNDSQFNLEENESSEARAKRKAEKAARKEERKRRKEARAANKVAGEL